MTWYDYAKLLLIGQLTRSRMSHSQRWNLQSAVFSCRYDLLTHFKTHCSSNTKTNVHFSVVIERKGKKKVRDAKQQHLSSSSVSKMSYERVRL